MTKELQNDLRIIGKHRQTLKRKYHVGQIGIFGSVAKGISHASSDVDMKDIPGEKMISMRNKVIHEYSGIDLEILWQTIKKDLPDLKKQIQKVRTETI